MTLLPRFVLISVLGLSAYLKLVEADLVSVTFQHTYGLSELWASLVVVGISGFEGILALMLATRPQSLISWMAAFTVSVAFLLNHVLLAAVGKEDNCGCLGTVELGHLEGALLATGMLLITLRPLVEQRERRRRWMA